MHTTWKAELLQAAVLTFEALCFLFPDTELTEQQRHAPTDVAVRVAFAGPFSGQLLIQLCGGLLPTLAANMLGQDEIPPEGQQYDALGEIANVICGNALPRIAGPQEVFQLDPPQLVARDHVVADEATALAAEVQLGLEQGRVDLRLFAETAVVPSSAGLYS